MNTPSRPAAARRIFSMLLLALALAPGSTPAQTTAYPPGQLSYQGFLVDANGGALATNAPRNYDVIFSLYDAPVAGNLLWKELQTVTVDRGYFSVMLGQGSSVAANLFTNNLTGFFAAANASDRYIGTTVRGLIGGGDVEIQPRLRLLSSPYSFLAANASAMVDGAGKQVVKIAGGNITLSNPIIAPAFSGNGASLTGLNPANLSGKIADSQLSSNVPLLDANNNFLSLGVGMQASWPLDVVANQAVGRFSSTRNSSGSVIELKNTRLVQAGQSHNLGAINFTTGNNASDISYRGQIFYVDNYDGSGRLSFSAAGAPSVLSVTSDGNVGIGTTTPPAGYKLVVIGTSSFWGSMGVVGNINATGTITPNSDRNLKTDFAGVDSEAVLEAVGKMPIQQWRFKNEKETVKHMGPMAQDFQSAFGLGEIPTAIATVDADGVALAAIQGLKHRTEEQAAELKARAAELQDLKRTVAELKQALDRLAPAGGR